VKYDVLIIGGGIVGLATAYQLKEKAPHLKVILLEKEDKIASHQTGNNSGVIHAGVYYKPGSLKATNCRKGYELLINFCNEHDINYDLCGKLIVATKESELPRLNELYERSQKNGLDKVKLIEKEGITQYEPYAVGLKALFVPYTGIIDYKDVAEKYKQLFTTNGGEILLNSQVQEIKQNGAWAEVITQSGNAYNTKLVVNTAGLFSDRIARLHHKNLNVRIIPFRGEYYELKPDSSHLVRGLIYPVPDPAFPFLGVHFTKKIDGGVEAGPNAVFAFKREGYKKTSFSRKDFFESITWKGFHKVAGKYWKTGLGEFYRSYNKGAFTRALQELVPSIQKSDLKTGGAGVRAQACDRNGGLVDDFLIIESQNQLDILNAPSPAATASLSIGLTIVEKIHDRILTGKAQIPGLK
jgi:(S)-2-hydroxyglutarate dehydrogenase